MPTSTGGRRTGDTGGVLASLPDPGEARTLDELIGQLRLLKIWAGGPSYETIKDRVNAAWSAAGRPPGELTSKPTVVDCFKVGRRRLNADLVTAVVEALHPDVGYVVQWRQALRVISGESQAAAQVRAQSTLPDDLSEFIGREDEVERILRLAAGPGGEAVSAAIVGLAGIGKTRLAIHIGHELLRARPFEHVLFVDLRGFHPDPGQPPAEPAAVLHSFLRLLGVPAHDIPHDPPARVGAYRRLLSHRRCLVVLDNAINERQVEPLLPGTSGSVALITSRHDLRLLRARARLTPAVFTPEQAVAFLARTVPGVPVGVDPAAPDRLAALCGQLPLALALLAATMQTTPGWTLSDHAERLGRRHRDGRLDVGVELALTLSYQHLPAERQQMFRRLALHPGPDFGAPAAAALAGVSVAAADAQLRLLSSDHLVHPVAPDRYALHDLVGLYGLDRAVDEDRQADRHASLTRLFDHYVEAAETAAVRTPDRSPQDSLAWLAIERPCLVAAAGYAATHGWPGHSVRLSAALARHLLGGHYDDALTVHEHAVTASRENGDEAGRAAALRAIGDVHYRLGRYETASDHVRQALALFRRLGDTDGEAGALDSLGDIERRLGRYRSAAQRHRRALTLYRRVGDRLGEADALTGLGTAENRLQRPERAAEHLRQAVAVYHALGDPDGEATALNNLGLVEHQLDRHHEAAAHLQNALVLFRRRGNPRGEGSALDSLGIVHTGLNRPERAAEHHRQALEIFRRIGSRDSEAWALNGLGEAARAAGDLGEAVRQHTAARAIAAAIGSRDQEIRAETGLVRALDELGGDTAQPSP